MSIDERDYMNEPDKGRKSPYYNPKDHRGPSRAPGEELFEWQKHQRKKPEVSAWPGLLVILVVAGAVYAFASRNDPDRFSFVQGFWKRASAPDLDAEYRRQQAESLETARQRQAQAAQVPKANSGGAQAAGTRTQGPMNPDRARESSLDPCGGVTPTTTGFWGLDAGRVQGQPKWFRFTNMLGMPVFIDIKRAADEGRVATAFVMPGQSTVLTTGVQHLSLTLSHGTAWCNGLVGWRDGRAMQVTGGLRVEPGAVGVTMEMRPGAGPQEQMSLAALQSYGQQDRRPREIEEQRRSMGTMEFPGPGTQPLMRNASGGYNVAGMINSLPVTFLVDTGASITSVPENMGGAIGMTVCQRRTFQTANGATVGCVGRVQSMSFGVFRLQNPEVVLMPNLSSPLLGMNALQGIQLVRQGGGMALVKP